MPDQTADRALRWTWFCWTWWAAVTLIMAATVAVYSGSLRGPFLFDDIPRIVNDTRLHSAWPPWPVINSTNRPLAHYTFALNYAAHQDEVFGYHLANLVIHLLAALTLFGLVRRSWLLMHTGQQWTALGLALAVALVWSVHPLNTQAVSYIVQRLESMMGLFYLLTIYCYARAQSSSRRWLWYALSISSCALGMACKEVMVTAPLVVALYGRSVARAKPGSERLYLLLLALTWGVLAWSMWHYQTDYRGGGLLSVKDVGPWTYLTNQSAVILHYLRLAIYPSGQCAYYAWPVEYSLLKLLPALASVGLMTLCALGLWFKRPALGFVALSFFVVLAPTSSIAPIVDLAFEHRMYVPLAAVVTLVCLGVGRWLKLLRPHDRNISYARVVFASLLLTVVVVALGCTTYARNRVYAREESFWSDITVKAPQNFNGWLGLGNVYAKQLDDQLAEKCFHRALEVAPDKARAQATYAGLLITRGRFDEAARLLDKALQSEPTLPEVVINHGLLLSLTGKFAEAQPYLEAGVNAAPNDEELQTNLIANLCYLQQFEQAYSTALANLQRRPHSARANNDVAACLLAKGDVAGAETYAQQAIALDSNLARAHATLGMAVSKRSTEQAIPHLETACQLDPSSYEFVSALATLKMAIDPSAAIELYRRALTLRPSEVEMMLRLAMAYDATGQPQSAIPLLEEALKLKPDLHPVRNYLRSLQFRASKNLPRL